MENSKAYFYFFSIITYEKADSRFQLLFNVLIISLPLTLNGFLSNIFNTLSTLVIPRCLVNAGFEHSEALAMIGKFTGMAMMIIGIPLIVVNSINMLLIPDLSQTIIKGNYYNASIRIKKVMKISFLLGLSTTVICLIIPDALGEMFYSRNDLGSYIKSSGLCAPIFFISVPLYSVLNGLNKQGIILRNSLLVAALELVCLYIFTSIPSINIYGYAITLFLTSLISIIINLYEIKKHITLNISLTNTLIYILLAVITYFIINIITIKLLLPITKLKSIIITISIFLIFIFWGTFGDNEN